MNQQKTEAWHQDRCDNITASRLTDCLAVTTDKWKVIRASGTTLKVCATEQACVEAWALADAGKPGMFTMEYVPGEPLKAFENYMQEIVCERLTGEVREIGEPPAIAWGNHHEPFALAAYEVRTGTAVGTTGFHLAPADTGLVNFGASPDGLIYEDGSLEVKCPLVSAQHIRCFTGGIPDEHKPQMEGQLIALGRDWVDFVSYDPRFKGDYEHLQLYICRYESDPDLKDEIMAAIIRMEAAVVQFIGTLPGPGDV